MLCRGSQVLKANNPPSFTLLVSEVYSATAPPCENPPITILSDGIDFASSSTRDFTESIQREIRNHPILFRLYFYCSIKGNFTKKWRFILMHFRVSLWHEKHHNIITYSLREQDATWKTSSTLELSHFSIISAKKRWQLHLQTRISLSLGSLRALLFMMNWTSVGFFWLIEGWTISMICEMNAAVNKTVKLCSYSQNVHDWPRWLQIAFEILTSVIQSDNCSFFALWRISSNREVAKNILFAFDSSQLIPLCIKSCSY